jgi:hypothetical protein
MQELISPSQSETLVLLMAGVLLLGGALWGWKERGASGVLLGLFGPLVYGLWQFHKWITRYDPASGYFGLDKVWVLLLEVALFVVLGAAVGVVLGKFFKPRMNTNEVIAAKKHKRHKN